MLAMFFAKTRMGWKETVVNRVNDHPQVPTGIEDPNAARQRNIEMIEQISDHLKLSSPPGVSQHRTGTPSPIRISN
jgi:hypothetical protein